MGANKLLVLLLVSSLFSGCASQDAPIDDIRDRIDALPTTTLETASSSTTVSTIPSTITTATTSTSLATTTSTSSTTSTTEASGGPIKVEVVYFHPSQPCANCMKVGKLAQETVEKYYPREQASGRVLFRKINLADPDNSGIIRKYGAYSSSIWIGTYNGDRFYKEQKIGVWYKIDDPEEYSNYLRTTINVRLAGEVPT